MEIQRSKERAKGEGGGGVEKQRAAEGQGKGLGLVSVPWFCPSVCQAGGQPWAGVTRGLGPLLLPLGSQILQHHQDPAGVWDKAAPHG